MQDIDTTAICCRKEWCSSTHLHIPLLYPFWGSPETEVDNNNKANQNRFTKYIEDAPSYLSVTGDRNKALWLFPTTLDYLSVPEVAACFERFSVELTAGNRTGIAFCNGDLPLRVNNDKITIFHTSIYRKFNTNKILAAVPFTSDPLLEVDKPVQPLPPEEIPIISFRGVAHPLSTVSSVKRLKEQFRYILYAYGALKLAPEKWGYGPRVKAIKQLEHCKNIDFRSHILPETPVNWSCGYFREAESAKQSFQEQRQTYLAEILNSHYVLCARGQGNYSLRFFETLAMGRIPVYIDSAGALPFEDQIDWRRHAIIVDHQDIPNIEYIIENHFHENSPAELEKMGDSNRELYLRYCTPEGFFAALFRDRLIQF